MDEEQTQSQQLESLTRFRRELAISYNKLRSDIPVDA